MTILVVTNDFPPRAGGIQAMVMQMLRHLDPAGLVVHTSRQDGDAEYDAALPYPIIRDPMKMLLPTPGLASRVQRSARRHGADRVWFPSSAPLGLLANPLREAGISRTVASTVGHEIWWATVPGARQALHQIGERNDVLTYLADYTRDRIRPALSPRAGQGMMRLVPGVDAAAFRPGEGRAEIRARHGLGDAPVVVCISRLVRRKGQDRLIQSLAQVRRAVPGVKLLIVGEGPYERDLRRLADGVGVAADVCFSGRVAWEELPRYLAAGDVFAMPCRTRNGGFDVEGLGIVFLEAAAVGLPVIVGDSGGAPDAVLDGETGFLVPGDDVGVIAQRLTWLFQHPEAAAQMGRDGRQWVRDAWRPEDQAEQLRTLLDG